MIKTLFQNINKAKNNKEYNKKFKDKCWMRKMKKQFK